MSNAIMPADENTTETDPEDLQEEQDDNESGFQPKTRWFIPNKLQKSAIAFMGKDILIVAEDIYIAFYNLRLNTELVYVASTNKQGDGVDVVSGSKTSFFAFAEKVKNARIFIVSYPSFTILVKLQDMEVNRYKGICLMESDLVAGFSGFPNYMITVWSWRTQQRLLAIPTGVIRRSQLYLASRSHILVCQCWGEGLIVWEVAQCYKRCMMMRRAKEEVTGWEMSEPPLVDLAWTSEGQLYAVDRDANLYAMLSDGIGMVANVEWSENLKGSYTPCLSHFGTGLLVYGPDLCLRLLKKSDGKWKVTWSFVPYEDIVRLLTNNAGDMAAGWTASGLLYRFTGDDDKMEAATVMYKQRNILNIQLIAPSFKYVATLNDKGVLCLYDTSLGTLVNMQRVAGIEAIFAASPCTSLLAVACRVGENYGVGLYRVDEDTHALETPPAGSMCLTHQSVTRVVFGPTGQHLMAAAMSAGHLFMFSISEDLKLNLVRYMEVGRGLADCLFMKVGPAMRAFALVLFSDKYAIGERIVCVNAETGKDNKFAGKMQGPYSRLLPLSVKDTMVAIPHLSKYLHVLKLNGEKGLTISVKMGAIIDSGHDLKQFNGVFTPSALMTFGFGGKIILRQPHAPPEYDLKLPICHRYGNGLKQADLGGGMVASLASGAATLTALCWHDVMSEQPRVSGTGLPNRPHLQPEVLDLEANVLHVINDTDKNYLDILEERKVREEALDVKVARAEVVKGVEIVRAKLVALLEENIAERPLHQLSLSEFNLHQENKKERYKQAEREREETRLRTEARIRAQDKVTSWIKVHCWDTMLTPRVKLFAIFSHYQVENYAVLPDQRDMWPELQQVEAFRAIETENDDDLFRPWEEPDMIKKEPSLIIDSLPMPMSSPSEPLAVPSVMSSSVMGQQFVDSDSDSEDRGSARDYLMLALSPSSAHKVLTLPAAQVPQMLAHSFLHMNWMQHVVKLTVQNLRLWFNKQFDDLMNQKKREVGLVEERNNRLRFIVEELNKLSDLRGSFHHLVMDIRDPQWRQEEQPHRLIKVDPEECSIEPYISPSQIVIVPPDPGPKDDFRERALMEMMDGVLEKLWHEEIKKPIPMPQCMLDKEPEHFNEEDLRLVFDYEAKVAFRNEERDKYRKMLHAEYAKLSQMLNESVVKFNNKVKETWLSKLKIDSCIGQENLNLMRLRRRNLDRVEAAEQVEEYRSQIARWNSEAEMLSKELALAQEQSNDVQTSYDALQTKDKLMERTFKNYFTDLSPIIVDQCYKFFRKRPKWQQRASMTPVVLYELATAVLTGVRPSLLHSDCVDYFKGVELLDLITNMPPVMDEGLWNTMCKLRRTKIENEIRMRGVALEMSYVEATVTVWQRAVAARKQQLQLTVQRMQQLREEVQLTARNATVQLVLPAGQVEILTTGHMADFEDASLVPRTDIEKINDLILRVGELKLAMMRRQIGFRKVILAKEWEHAQMKMKLRHMDQELYTYKRLKIPKELQLFLKNKTLGYTEEMEYVRMEKEMEASKMTINMLLNDQIHAFEDLQVKINDVEGASEQLDRLIGSLTVKVSEKRLLEDPLEPIRIRRIFKKRMETLVMRSKLVREVQQNHTTIVMLQTELELLRLKTYPTLATFKTMAP